MKSEQFCYWLQGLFELKNPKELDEVQVKIIKNHLKLVFLYDIDPSYTEDPRLNKIFNNIHDGKDPFDCEDVSLKKPGMEIFEKDYVNPSPIVNC